MKILLVGSGAREHAIAWKLKSSPLVESLVCAPGNAGMAEIARCVPIGSDDLDGIEEFAEREGIDLVASGPEQPLALGLEGRIAEASVRRMERGGVPILFFGPSEGAARIEASKAFSKKLMSELGIPTARYATFTSYPEARAFLQSPPWPFVVKASGLAAGKGVFLPETFEEANHILDELFERGSLGEAGREVIIEERLEGEEVSILGFCDGRRVAPMPPAQDHKRLLEGDRGPNTGGMGAVASALPGAMDKARELSKLFLEPAAVRLADRGTPFVGVLYAGLILTREGPKALEFNCRFGDPETEAILPLLDSDLAGIMLACAQGKLDAESVRWRQEASACVVLASEGYATSSRADQRRAIIDHAPGLGAGGESARSFLFHGATGKEGSSLTASGGRLLCAAGLGDSVGEAVDKAYSRLARIQAERVRYRKDVGAGRNFISRPDAALSADPVRPASGAYAAAGVDIDSGDRAVELMKSAVVSTYGPEVLAGIGAFGGVYDAAKILRMESPLLVASTDGVGTKVRIAAATGSYESVGMDIVNHCIDDILVQGASPLFFLDYFATSKLDPSMVAEIVGGMARACRESGCALVGGETAEMPGVYGEGEFDIAGAIVGVVEKRKLLPRTDLAAGDLLLGIPSSGLHTNGYSLARKVFAAKNLESFDPELGCSLGEALLAPHRSYLPLIKPWIEKEPGTIKALAHITGGGFEGNIPRILQRGTDAVVCPDSWPMPPLFGKIMREGEVDREEMYRVFNMGIGMVAVVARKDAHRVLATLGEGSLIIGELVASESAGAAKVRLEFGRRFE